MAAASTVGGGGVSSSTRAALLRGGVTSRETRHFANLLNNGTTREESIQILSLLIKDRMGRDQAQQVIDTLKYLCDNNESAGATLWGGTLEDLIVINQEEEVRRKGGRVVSF
jgi:hypothetical protein